MYFHDTSSELSHRLSFTLSLKKKSAASDRAAFPPVAAFKAKIIFSARVSSYRVSRTN